MVEESIDTFAGNIEVIGNSNDKIATLYAKFGNNKDFDGLVKYELI